MTGESFFPSMGQISNRGLIARMKQWGWSEGKHKGDSWIMQSPSGRSVALQPPHAHQGNNKFVINEMLDVMGIDWKTFITFDFSLDEMNVMLALSQLPPEEARAWLRASVDYAESILGTERKKEAEAERERQRKQKEAKKQEQKEKKVAEQKVVIAPPELANPAPQHRDRIINRVFDHMVKVGEPMSVGRIARELNINHSSVGNATIRMWHKGVLDRLKPGVYKIKTEHQRQDVRIDVVARSDNGELAPIKVVEAKPEPSKSEPPKPAPAPEPTRDVERDFDTQVWDILDLMFPNGFKAKHMPLIEKWREATLALIKEVEGG